MTWLRVNKEHPCRQCRKTDWCTYSPELGLLDCMRISSNRPAKNGGWIHSLGDAPKTCVPLPRLPTPTLDAARLLSTWKTPQDALETLANNLGVSCDSLRSLDARWAWQHSAWAFPMVDGQGNIIGIRLRNDGRKWAVKGSQQGIFVPNIMPQDVVFILEGPTDTAAAVSLGFYSIGRPNCCCGGLQIRGTLARLGIKRVIMVADNDEPGLQGAAKVAKEIGLPHVTLCPPCKDFRQMVNGGATRQVVESLVNQQTWSQ